VRFVLGAGPKNDNRGMIKSAGDSIDTHPHLLSIIGPHFFEECLPYGARILKIIRVPSTENAIVIQ
jgi:hypothetical protein